MQMQKKITVKDDGRFLTYYHFPATASAEETQVFEQIQEERQASSVEHQDQPLNAQPSTLDAQPSTLTLGGDAHV